MLSPLRSFSRHILIVDAVLDDSSHAAAMRDFRGRAPRSLHTRKTSRIKMHDIESFLERKRLLSALLE